VIARIVRVGDRYVAMRCCAVSGLVVREVSLSAEHEHWRHAIETSRELMAALVSKADASHARVFGDVVYRQRWGGIEGRRAEALELAKASAGVPRTVAVMLAGTRPPQPIERDAWLAQREEVRCG